MTQARLPQAWLGAVMYTADPGVSGGSPQHDRRRAGLGVFVASRNLVTCAHVVAEALGLDPDEPPPPGARVEIQHVIELSKSLAEVRVWQPIDDGFSNRLQDLCLLELLDRGGFPSATWDQLTEQEPRPTNVVKVFGYPQGRIPGTSSIGYTVADVAHGGWWTLNPPATHASVAIDKGFSGSLVWDNIEGKAIGLLVARYGSRPYLIPMRIVRDACETRASPLPNFPSPPMPVRTGQAPTEARPKPRDGYDVFLCHSSQDKDQVRALTRVLRGCGLRVFLDEDELIPGRPWMEALEVAIQESRAAAILYGPAGIGPWAVREMRAFLEEFVRRDAAVIPVILPGAPSAPELPIFLRQFTWVDLRQGLKDEVLQRFVSAIRAAGTEVSSPLDEAVPMRVQSPRFRLWNVPPLPERYQVRRELETLRRILTDASRDPLALTGQHTRFTVEGMGGVGKTVLAAALARDPDVRRAFPDGIFWLTIGQTPGDLLLLQARLMTAVTGREATPTAPEQGKRMLRDALVDRACLLVLDDVWDVAHAYPFNVLGDRGRLLITTRKRDVGRELDAVPRALDELPVTDALLLLSDHAGIPVEQLPPEARAIVEECGELPLAIAMVGSVLRDRPLDRWARALQQLRSPEGPRVNLEATIQLSMDDLPGAVRSRYLDFAVFAEDTPIPEAVLKRLWAPLGMSDWGVQEVVDTLVDRSLLRRDSAGRLMLHDLQHDYVRKKVGDRRELHIRLVQAYRSVTEGGALHTVAADGYFFEHFGEHLMAAEGINSLRALLLDHRWLAAKLKATEVNALLADFDLQGVGPHDPLRLLHAALRLSGHVLARDPEELPSQLLGRLRAAPEAELHHLCARVEADTVSPFFLPLWQGLTPPGGPLIRTLEGHAAAVNAVALSADGRVAVSSFGLKMLKVWNVEIGEELRTLEGHVSAVNAVALSADGKTAVSASKDRTLKVWSVETGEVLQTLEGHADEVNAVALSADGRTAVSGSGDGTLKVWNVETGKELRTLEGHASAVNAVALSADGKTAVSGSGDKALRVWDVETGEELRMLEGHIVGTNTVALSADGKTAISETGHWKLQVWDVKTGRPIQTLAGHSLWVNEVALSADGKTAVSGSGDRTLRVWDVETGEMLQSYKGHAGGVNAVALSADGRTAVSGSGDRTLKVWDMEASEESQAHKGHVGGVNAVALSADGRTAVSCSSDRTLKVWDAETGEELWTLLGHAIWVNAVALSADGKTAVSGSSDKTLKVWSVDTGEELRTLRGHVSGVNAVALSVDGRTAVSGSDDRTLRVWSVETGEELRTMEGHASKVNEVALSADGKTVVSGSDDRTLKVWELGTGKDLRTLGGHTGAVRVVGLSADGKTAVSGSDDRTLKVWEPGTGKELRTLSGHTGAVRAVGLSADGRTAVSGSDDRTLKVWDVKAGTCLASFTGEAPFTALALYMTERIFAGDLVGRIHLLALRLAR